MSAIVRNSLPKMRWFDGTMAEAVSISKKKNVIFVVFVEGNGELSEEMSAAIDTAPVLYYLKDERKFLAVKLKSGSANYTHFAQLYQFVPVPSLFFIGHNGTPLEVVCAGVQPDDLAARIDRILQQYLVDSPSVARSQMQASTSSQSMRQSSAKLIHSEAANAQGLNGKHREETESPLQPAQKIQKTEQNEAVKNAAPKQDSDNQEYEVVCEGDVCVRRPKVKASDAGPNSEPTVGPNSKEDVPPPMQVDQNMESQEDINAKVEMAKKLLEARQREKEELKKEEEKRKELERRATGQGVAELKRWQEEQEMKHIQEERKREKMENDLARQRILAQIAQDRAERRARDAPPQAEPPAATSDSAPVNSSGAGAGSARIQFKLPDGASHTAHFPSDGTLQQVHRYVADNLQLSQSNFSLWTAFPRRELTDAEATLRDLQLTPSAALLVMPRRAANTVSRPSAFNNVITFLSQLFTSFILQPTMEAAQWVRARVFPPPPPSAPSPINRPAARPAQRTNVHRLHGDGTSDDDNNTWNGNSTQQM